MKPLKRKLTSSLALFVVLSATQLASAFYDPGTGRWLSRDPVVESGGPNLYGFVYNCPLNFIDNIGRKGVGTVGSANPQNVRPVLELLAEAEGEPIVIDLTVPVTAAILSSTQTKKKCPTCCTCVTSLGINNVQPLKEGILYGHEFDVQIGLQYIVTKSGQGGDATLQWSEKSNRPPRFYNTDPNTWVDLNQVYPQSNVFDNWYSREKPCPGFESVTLHDAPVAHINQLKRTIRFRITVTSAPNCPCAIKSLTVTAIQFLDPVGPRNFLHNGQLW